LKRSSPFRLTKARTTRRNLRAIQITQKQNIKEKKTRRAPQFITIFWGSVVENASDAIVIARRTQYTSQPFNKWCLIDKENKEFATAGPNVRMIEAIICPRPFVAPKEALFGAAPAMKMKMQPK